MQSQIEVPDISKLGFILEVEAESERVLGDKLYGPDDLEAAIMASPDVHDVDEFLAECEAQGIDPYEHDAIGMELYEPGLFPGAEYTSYREVQEEYESVNDLLRNAVIGGCPVLLKTDGTNLGDPTEIPHFGHSVRCKSSGKVADTDDCWDEPGAGGVYRMFPAADLIVLGEFDLSGRTEFNLRDDVRIMVSSVERASLGTVEAEPVE